MPPPDTISVLNRVLAMLYKSFPQYIMYSRPYIPPSRHSVLETFQEIANNESMLADRISEQIADANGLPDTGFFPMEFTDTHDLSIDYMLREAIRYQREEIAMLEACRDELSLAPMAGALAEEAVGMGKGHLESLEELIAGDASKQTSAVS
jgi:bacterioferritin (cytochrome b1)